jgi:hypothetical protein
MLNMGLRAASADISSIFYAQLRGHIPDFGIAKYQYCLIEKPAYLEHKPKWSNNFQPPGL